MRFSFAERAGPTIVSSLAVRAALVVTFSVVATGAVSAQARSGVLGAVSAARPDTISCGSAGFLVGLTEQQTDRIVGVQFECVTATSTQGWDASSLVHRLGFGDMKHGAATTKRCPTDYYIVGFAATMGSYSGDASGSAQADPPELLADLAPVCRNRQGAIYPTNRSPLTQAEDNRLQPFAWDGLGGARSCRAGFAAVKISFIYDGRRNIDPANRFRDAALTCRRLPVMVAPMATHSP